MINPPIEGVQEFKMITSGFAAEYGRFAGEVFEFVFRLRTRHIAHHPVGLAVGVLHTLVADIAEVSGFLVRLVHFVHLLFEVLIVEVALLCRIGTVLRVRDFARVEIAEAE